MSFWDYLKLKVRPKLVLVYYKLLTYLVECRKDSIKNDNFKVLDLPLIYISQPPRTGGTFTRNLFDGHPEVLASPFELSWEPNGFRFEKNFFENKTKKESFKYLLDEWIFHFKFKGLDKKYPFEFEYSVLKDIFYSKYNSSLSTREICSLYLSSFFYSWMNHKKDANPKYFVAFTPMVADEMKYIDNFFDTYPNGYRIHVVREPKSWWSSEKNYGHNKNQKTLEDYIESNWLDSVNIALKMQEKYPDRYIVLLYEDLVLNIEEIMKVLSKKLGIAYSSILTTPTYNSEKRHSNSSFSLKSTKIDKNSLDRWKEKLSKDEIKKVDSMTKDLYLKIKEKSIKIPS